MQTQHKEDPTESILKTESIKYVVASLIGIIAFLGIHLVKEVAATYNLLNLPGITNKSLVLLSSLLGMLFLLAAYLAFKYYRKTHVKPPSGGYLYVVDPGYYYHIKTKGHYCNPCLSKGYASRLSIHHEDGLKCRLCGEVYISPKASSAAFLAYMENNSHTEDQLEHHFSKYKEP